MRLVKIWELYVTKKSNLFKCVKVYLPILQRNKIKIQTGAMLMKNSETFECLHAKGSKHLKH